MYTLCTSDLFCYEREKIIFHIYTENLFTTIKTKDKNQRKIYFQNPISEKSKRNCDCVRNIFSYTLELKCWKGLYIIYIQTHSPIIRYTIWLFIFHHNIQIFKDPYISINWRAKFSEVHEKLIFYQIMRAAWCVLWYERMVLFW